MKHSHGYNTFLLKSTFNNNKFNVCVTKNICTNICNDGIKFCIPIYLNYDIYPDNNKYCILNNNSENRVYYPPPSSPSYN